jgi:hypothetical protein
MKACVLLTRAVLIMTILMLIMIGCKYDGPTAVYDQPQPPVGPTPVISALIPDTAKAGVNYITISGDNFSATKGKNHVYFGNVPVDAISESSTVLTVRRPNLTGDSITVKVVTDGALMTAIRGPYRIDPVIASYGGFIEDKFLSAVAVDAEENIYVSSVDSMFIFKVTPGAPKTVLLKATQVPVDMKFGPDGRLYLVGGGSGTGGNKNIFVCNTQTGELHQWVSLSKTVKFGEFDANGYFFVGGGSRVDIWAIAPDSTATATNTYASTEVIAMKIYDNYLYVVTKSGTGANTLTDIYRNAIGANGTLGSAEHILNWITSPYGSRTIRGITFSAAGIMYIATDSADPILSFDPATNEFDYFYKDLLPAYVRDFQWGPGNYLYMTTGKTDVQEWTVYRVDMGTTCGSN